MAALMASRLAKTIYEEFKEKPESVELWSDSKVVLHWLRSDISLMKAFVAVRLAGIQSTWNEAKSIGDTFQPTLTQQMISVEDFPPRNSMQETEGRMRYWIMSSQRDLKDWQIRFSDLAPFVKKRRSESRRKPKTCTPYL